MRRFSIRNIFVVTIFAGLCASGMAARTDIAAFIFLLATTIFLFYVQVRQIQRETMRPNFESVIEHLNLMELLHEFCPTVIGTPPLRIDVETSDIDIACTCDNPHQFKQQCSRLFGTQADYSVVDTSAQDMATVIVRFSSQGWDIEIFCQPIPIEKQWGVRHFRIEQRILACDERVSESIRNMKKSGMKTEPAFAKLLGLQGDPYTALLELESKTDSELDSILTQIQFD